MNSANESTVKTLIEKHVARNHALKKLLHDKGVVLEYPRLIDLHFWSKRDAAADDLARHLNEAGYPVTTKGRVEHTDFWSVESQIEASPLEITEELFIDRLVRLALNHQSEFDGWGTLVP